MAGLKGNSYGFERVKAFYDRLFTSRQQKGVTVGYCNAFVPETTG
ncbi:hypothetical protein FLA_4885 [Filimonas lacunae]|nr:hypothetical protein FLA_4885 [Filimonas lacunae]